MVRSMTGFGSGTAEEEGRKARVEIRALNHRFLEVNARLPRPFLLLEERVRKTVAQVVSRGHLDIYITIEQENAKKRQVKVDKELIMAYYDYLKEMAQFLDIPADVGLRDLVAVPGAFQLVEEEEDPDEVWPVVASALEQALTQLVVARSREGERLGEDLRARLYRLEGYVGQIEGLRKTVLENYRQRLQARVQELLGPSAVLGERLQEEVVYFAERSDVTEEVVRLRSHLAEMLASLEATVPVGRKLDFLVQEIHREVTTVGAKAAGSSISQLVVACKEEIEKIREQVQNLE